MQGLRKTAKRDSIAVIGNYLPRQCGIATFTTDLCNALADELKGEGDVVALAMDDVDGGYPYPDRVRFQLRAHTKADYLRAADFLNVHMFDAVILQHEYGIFGGKSGADILLLLESLRMPILTTLHTVLAEPEEEQRIIVNELEKYSDRLIVMSHKAGELLRSVYGIPQEKIAFIPHGIPDVPFVDTSFYKDKFAVEDRKVVLSFGLLNPGKGIEFMIEALPEIIEEHPDIVYIVLGATHPHVKKATGDAYRHELLQMVSRLELEDYVIFHNQFVSLEVLCEYIGAADIYVTTYISLEQIASGTLAYTLGAGKAVVSSPYWYAEELLDEDRGKLVPFCDSAAIAREVNHLLSNDVERNAMRKRAYQFCRPMVWKEVARGYLRLIVDVNERWISAPKPRYGMERIPKILDELPEINLHHLRVMTDDTGMLRYAIYATPNRDHGYCTNDNSRALVATSMYTALSQDMSVIPLIHTYLSFLSHAFNREYGRFRNLMTYDRRWGEEADSEDTHARALWGLGAGVKYAPNDSIRNVATRLFHGGLEAVENFTSPLAWAFTLIGLHAYLEVYSGDATARRIRAVLARKLKTLFDDNADDKWLWCGDTVSYENARLPHALILAGQWVPDASIHETGLVVLEWLFKQQTTPEGHLSLIGNSNWMTRSGVRSNFDQQAIDAMGLIEACAEAFRSTGDKVWLKQARKCLAWFLGRNDLNARMYDFKTGGCSDGLQPHGPNANQGAKSTLSWLISLLTMIEILGQGLVKGEESSTADNRTT